MARSCSTSKNIVYLALLGDLLVASTKVIAAVVTGSAAMLSEAIHSLVDSTNEWLLLHGYKMALRRPDAIHPLGYGRELYFWSFIVALMLFGLGAGASLYHGVQHILEPAAIEHPVVNYVVLGCAFVFEGISWLAAFRKLRATRGELTYWQAIHRSKDPPSFMVLFEDSAALAGNVIAALGIYLSLALDLPVLDGVASVLIGLILAIVAGILARESKSLLIGERANPTLVTGILALAAATPGVSKANGALTVHLAPDQILAGLSVEFVKDLHADQIEACVQSIEQRIQNAHPEIVTLFIKPQTNERYQVWRAMHYGPADIHSA
ncbi:cation diffusion facilitator family transporter [Dyella sp. C11]|uniref:cation diffusion facilitator family transporter n=1 Tax=Dyella sp. C11 TaxID=2126991 RepID=UPI000D6576C2|nr:cation diffusion facilitator family transporter [Dyella sp. C11]